MELINALGLDWKILIAQLINFAILLFILYKIGYKPILTFIHERMKKIDDGVMYAKEAEKALADAKEAHRKLIADAHKEGKKIIDQAVQTAETKGAAMIKKYEKDATALLDKAQKTIEREQDKMMTNVKTDIAALVVGATEKLLQHTSNKTTDKTMINNILKDLDS